MVMQGASVGQDTPVPPASPDLQQVSTQPGPPTATWEDLQRLQSSLDARFAQTEQFYSQRLSAAEQAAYEAQQRAVALEQQNEELFEQLSQAGYQSQATAYDAEGNPISPQQNPADRRLQKRLNQKEQEIQNLRLRQEWEKENTEAQRIVNETLARTSRFGVGSDHPEVQQAARYSQTMQERPSQWAARVTAAAVKAMNDGVDRWEAAQRQVQQQRQVSPTAPAPQQGHPLAPAPVQEQAGPSAGNPGGALERWDYLSQKERNAFIDGMKRGKYTRADL